MSGLLPYGTVFREQGERETRVITLRGYPGVPDGEYALVDAYCDDPTCDCRRVMLNVVTRSSGLNYLASISYGFDRDDEMAGPFLDPLNRQCSYAKGLLELVKQVLADPAYVVRLESHYRQFKRAMTDPQDAFYQRMRQAVERAQAADARVDAKVDTRLRAAPIRTTHGGTKKKRKKVRRQR